MADSDDKSLTLTWLDLAFVSSSQPKIVKAFQALDQELGHRPRKRKRPDRVLVDGHLLPGNDNAEYYLWFHIDLPKKQEADNDLFFHLRFMQKPDSSPPTELMKLQQGGQTIEWFLENLNKHIANERLVIVAEASVVVKNVTQTRLTPPNSIKFDEHELIGCGAEYRTTESSVGLNEFSYSKKKNGEIEISLSYIFFSSAGKLNPWTDEERRCRKYVDSLL